MAFDGDKWNIQQVIRKINNSHNEFALFLNQGSFTDNSLNRVV